MDELLSKLGIYIYVIVLGFIGGVLSLFEKKKLNGCDSSKICLIKKASLGVVTAIFTGYIGYEFGLYILESQKIALAISCVCAWAGTDALIAFESKILELLSKGIKKND
mgnify:CR=1 FL=1